MTVVVVPHHPALRIRVCDFKVGVTLGSQLAAKQAHGLTSGKQCVVAYASGHPSHTQVVSGIQEAREVWIVLWGGVFANASSAKKQSIKRDILCLLPTASLSVGKGGGAVALRVAHVANLATLLKSNA